jgi:ATP-dependent Clp protease ATP-binding subunit ClpA
MFERFTDRARQVLASARTQARELNHPYIGSEHILLGLAIDVEGVAGHILQENKLDFESLRLCVKDMTKNVKTGEVEGQPPLTENAKRVLEGAWAEARTLSHNYIGTEHMLLAILKFREGLAFEILEKCDLKPELLRKEVLDLLHPEALSNQAPIVARTLPRLDEESKKKSVVSKRGFKVFVMYLGFALSFMGLLTLSTKYEQGFWMLQVGLVMSFYAACALVSR